MREGVKENRKGNQSFSYKRKSIVGNFKVCHQNHVADDGNIIMPRRSEDQARSKRWTKVCSRSRASAFLLHVQAVITSICKWRIVTKIRKSERTVRDHRSFKPCALARALYRHDMERGARSERERRVATTRVTSFSPTKGMVFQRFRRAVTFWPAFSTVYFT